MRSVDRPVAWCVLLLVAFLVYGSLAPLSWQGQPLAQAWQTFIALPLTGELRLSRTDIAVNVLLQVPLAFGLTHLAWQIPRLNWRVLAVVVVWPALLLLAVMVEFAQIYFPPRNPSWVDVAAQATGAFLGLVVFLALRHRFDAWLQGFQAQAPLQTRRRQWLAAYLAVLLLFSLLPLDLTVSPVEIYRKWRDGRVVLVPFGAINDSPAASALSAVQGAALWLPVGCLLRLLRQPSGRWAAAVITGGVAAVFVEVAQLLVLSRVSDVTDILCAIAGLALGASLPGYWARASGEQRRLGLHFAGLVWLALVALDVWWPLNFSARHEQQLAPLWQVLWRSPLQSYLAGDPFGALGELGRKIFMLAPNGVFWALASRPEAAARWPAAGPVLGFLLLAAVLELGQRWLPSRHADATDFILMAMGGIAGWFLTRALKVNIGQSPPQTPAPCPQATAQAESIATAPELRWSVIRAPPLAVQAVGWMALVPASWWCARQAARLAPSSLLPGAESSWPSWLGWGALLWWLAVAPMWLLPARRTGLRVGFPLWGGVHALVGLAVALVLMPIDVPAALLAAVGAESEETAVIAVRWAAMSAIAVQCVYGGALLTRACWRPETLLDLIYWALLAVPLCAAVLWVAVDTPRALADVSWLSLMLFLSAAAGSASAAAWVLQFNRRRLVVLAVIGLAGALGLVSVQGACLAPVSLLGPAGATACPGRWGVLGLVLTIFALQLAHWQALRAEVARPAGMRPHPQQRPRR